MNLMWCIIDSSLLLKLHLTGKQAYATLRNVTQRYVWQPKWRITMFATEMPQCDQTLVWFFLYYDS